MNFPLWKSIILKEKIGIAPDTSNSSSDLRVQKLVLKLVPQWRYVIYSSNRFKTFVCRWIWDFHFTLSTLAHCLKKSWFWKFLVGKRSKNLYVECGGIYFHVLEKFTKRSNNLFLTFAFQIFVALQTYLSGKFQAFSIFLPFWLKPQVNSKVTLIAELKLVVDSGDVSRLVAARCLKIQDLPDTNCENFAETRTHLLLTVFNSFYIL